MVETYLGPVHPHFPYDGFRQGDGPCQMLLDGKRCHKYGDEIEHQRIVHERSPWRKLITVEVFYQHNPKMWNTGMHVAQVAWQSENQATWFSAWSAPHNDCANFHRIEHLDVWSTDDAGRWISRLTKRDMNYEMLAELGITSN